MPPKKGKNPQSGEISPGSVFKPPLGHRNRCDFPKRKPLEHAPGGQSSPPPRLLATQPSPVREAAMTVRPVAPVIPAASPGRRRQGNSGARRPMPLG